MLEEQIKTWVAWLGSLGALLVAIVTVLKRLSELKRILKPVTIKIVPGIKIVITLFIPNLLLIVVPFYFIATFYFGTKNMDYLITNYIVFWELVISQAVLVSAWSTIWGVYIYPRLDEKIGIQEKQETK